MVLSAGDCHGQTIDPAFSEVYSYTDLGSIPDLPTQYGGLCLLAGDPSTLIIGGSANTPNGAIYSVPLIRDSSFHIIGFAGPASIFCEAAYNDGGVTYGPGGVLFASRWPVNELGQILPGSNFTNKIIDLTPFGV